MKKFDLKLPRETWGQLRSKYPADSEFIMDDDFTAGTKNLDTTVKGVITKRPGSVPYNPTPLTLPAKDQYEAIFEDGIHHLLAVQSGEIKYSQGDGVFEPVQAGTGFVAQSNFDFTTMNSKVYMGNGINTPQVYDRTTSYGGVTYTAPRMKVMGCQVPTTAATLKSQTGSGGVPENASGYRYKVAFVYYDNEESNGGPASAVINVGAGGSDITLENIPTGGYGVTKRNIYRSVDGLDDYLSVGTLSNNTAIEFVDNQAAGVIAIATNHDLPPVFGGITGYQEAVWVHEILGEPFTLRYSNKGQPDIMPEKNYLICNQQDPLVAKIVFRGRLIVLNRNSMGQVLGNNFFNYQYQDIQGSVGCVDARSVQIRTISGIPTLIWLSDKGLYSYNGNSVDYASNDIEDLINFNIQQAQYNNGKQEFSSDSEFNSLVRSDGIIVDNGDLTTLTPRKVYSTQFDWDDGTIVDLATSQGTATIKSLSEKVYGRTESGSTNSGTINSGGNIQLPTKSAVGSENGFGLVNAAYEMTAYDWAQPLQRPDSGKYVQLNFAMENVSASSHYREIFVHRDLSGNPAPSPEYSSGLLWFPGNSTSTLSLTINIATASNEKIWIVTTRVASGVKIQGSSDAFFTGGTVLRRYYGTSAWLPTTVGDLPVDIKSFRMSYSFNQDITTKSGSWTSAEFDTDSIYVDGQISYLHTTLNELTIAGTLTTSSVIIQGSNTEISPRIWSTAGSITAPSFGINNFTPSSKYRYWRIIVSLYTPDNRSAGLNFGTPRMVSDPSLIFPTSGTWESDPIFTSDDTTSLDALTSNTLLPAQVVLEVATAPAIGGPYTAYSSIGAATPDKYTKVRATLSTISNVPASVGEIIFEWSMSATAEVDDSTPINTTLNNVGWNIFLADVALNGGTTVFEMKSASTIGGIPGASFVTISPLAFPSGVPTNQYAKWKVTINSSGSSVPVIGAVIPQWYLGTSDSIRVASLFYNRSYYLAAAKFGSATNNLLVVLDGEGKWRVYEDINVSTLGLFYNDPYFGSADAGTFLKFLTGTLDQNTTPVSLDVRTRAFDFGKLDPAGSDKVKLLKQVEVRFANTGATYQVWYSVDEGQNFYAMYTDTGASSYTTSVLGTITPVRFRVNYDLAQPFSGRTIMIRVTNNDALPVQIHNIRFKGFIREADVINISQ